MVSGVVDIHFRGKPLVLQDACYVAGGGVNQHAVGAPRRPNDELLAPACASAAGAVTVSRRIAPPLVSGPAALASRLLSVALALAGLRAFLVRLVAFLSAFPFFAFAFALARWLARVLASWLGRCCCRRPFSVAFLLCLRRRLCC